MQNLKITIKTLFGFEEVLKQECEELGYKDVKILNRAVQIEGSWTDIYNLNYNLRCAISVLVELDHFRIREEADIYKKASKIDWTSLFDVERTFAVKGAVNSSLFNHSQYPFLVVKDAIADAFRDKVGERPDVDLKHPDVMIDVYVREKEVTISLNTSGAPLFQRGYRQATGDAPLNEVVAAGLLRLSGWDKKSTFVDPFCGSGTLVIEAALLACDIPSMINREYFAFESLKTFNYGAWKEIKNKANKSAKQLDFEIKGSDIDHGMIIVARKNVRTLPIAGIVDFSAEDFNDLKITSKKGVLISNPPYGERIGENIEKMYENLGDWFKTELKGFNCWIISSNMDGFKYVGLRPDRRIKLYNGSLECSFRKFSIYDGSKRTKFQDPNYKPRERKGITERAERKPRGLDQFSKEARYGTKEEPVKENFIDKIKRMRGEAPTKNETVANGDTVQEEKVRNVEASINKTKSEKVKEIISEKKTPKSEDVVKEAPKTESTKGKSVFIETPKKTDKGPKGPSKYGVRSDD